VHWLESLEWVYPDLASSSQFWRMISARHRPVSLHPSSATRQYAVGTRSGHLVALAPALMLANCRSHGSTYTVFFNERNRVALVLF
jgi:hypothetical protein